jgi:predicted RNase H-like nuclease
MGEIPARELGVRDTNWLRNPPMKRTTEKVIVGVDCATQAKNVGLACGVLDGDRHLVLRHVTTGLTAGGLVRQIAGWIEAAPDSLLALDAPLGWPAPLETALSHHAAGEPLGCPPDALFLRDTDHHIHKRLGKRPLEVGADRIARTAAGTLELLAEIRNATGLPVPLAWTPDYRARSAAIEVYPAATLRALAMPIPQYKGTETRHAEGRRRLAEALRPAVGEVEAWTEVMEAFDDALDAVVCVLAGVDFLRGESVPPANLELARREGWIWCRSKVARASR